jgi:hypothetical protein
MSDDGYAIRVVSIQSGVDRSENRFGGSVLTLRQKTKIECRCDLLCVLPREAAVHPNLRVESREQCGVQGLLRERNICEYRQSERLLNKLQCHPSSIAYIDLIFVP